jgi:hypothetical protein
MPKPRADIREIRCFVDMETRGRKAKPVAQKQRLGNPGKRSLPAPVVVSTIPSAQSIPAPHRPLLGTDAEPGAGLVLWRMLWRSGLPWLRDGSDSELMMMVCEMVDERQLLRDLVMSDPSLWRERAGLRQLDAQIEKTLSILGFSPTDRARLGLGEVVVNELEAFRERIASKRSVTK